jgi:hypothetical protein
MSRKKSRKGNGIAGDFNVGEKSYGRKLLLRREKACLALQQSHVGGCFVLPSASATRNKTQYNTQHINQSCSSKFLKAKYTG